MRGFESHVLKRRDRQGRPPAGRTVKDEPLPRLGENRLVIGAVGIDPEFDHPAWRVKAAGNVTRTLAFSHVADVDDHNIFSRRHGNQIRCLDLVNPRTRLRDHLGRRRLQGHHITSKTSPDMSYRVPCAKCRLVALMEEQQHGQSRFMSPPDPISIWDLSSAEPDTEHPLDGDAEADVAIVGGGYTGLSTALHAAEKGLTAHVLEAEKIGFGGSGRNVGLVNAGVWHPPAAIQERLGDTYGPRFLRLFGEAPQRVFDLIETHQIRCEVTRSGTLHAAHAPSGMQGLRARHAQWQALGAPVDLLTRHQMAERTGSKAYFGGLLDRRAGTVNPMGYCRGLARAAIAAGARISTRTKATRLSREGDTWLIETPMGRLRAAHVILATNAYTSDLWPGLDRVFTPIPYFQFATAPLGADVADILPGRQGVWDTARVMTSIRKDADGRLIVGAMGRVLGAVDRGVSYRWAAKRLQTLFPNLGRVTFENAWHGSIAMTPDHLPRIYALAPKLYTPIGYNGRGITTGTVLGAAMADLVLGRDPRELPLPITPVRQVATAPIMSRLYQSVFTAAQVWRGF